MRNARRGATMRLAVALAVVAALFGLLTLPTLDALAQRTAPDELRTAPVGGNVPGGTLGAASDAEMWRAVRGGGAGMVSIPDKKAATLVQSEGELWRSVRNGPLATYGAWTLLGMLILLALFFALRGRIKVEGGFSGRTITRFNVVERTAHWLMASSFIVLAVSGLNLLYGRYFLPDLIGKPAFAAITYYLKVSHHYVAFAFMVGLAVVFAIWVLHNLPNRHDLVWLLKGGGMFTRGSHPPAKKFNAGQKIVFWLTVLGGLSLSLSGWALMFPFTTSLFAETFGAVNAVLGTALPETLSPLQEQQLATVWHAAVALGLTAVIMAHIYIGSLGMQGAFAAMGSGEVDRNWARAHHPIWVEDEEKKAGGAGSGTGPVAQPAE